MNAYAIAYGLQLFSDFTYFLNDPVNGDQFEQADRRIVLGGDMTRQWRGTIFGRSAENLIGLSVRHDHIGLIGTNRPARSAPEPAVQKTRLALLLEPRPAAKRPLMHPQKLSRLELAQLGRLPAAQHVP